MQGGVRSFNRDNNQRRVTGGLLNRDPVIVSACLVGVNCRYDGGSAFREDVLELQGRPPIPLCPEQLGGLPTPRVPAEISEGGGRDVLRGTAHVEDLNGMDVTERFLNGAYEVLKIMRLFDIRKAVLKDKSPSCGGKQIYRKGRLIEGMGVTAFLLNSAGIKIKVVE